jgi:hypothetical protein
MQLNQSSEQAPAELPATVQVLTLPVGIYAFTVNRGGSLSSAGFVLPALHVTPAPVTSNGTVEFLASPTTLDRWLTCSSDVVTVKISNASATLLLTSLSGIGSEALAIDVRRLDTPPAPVIQVDEVPDTERVQAQTLVHVQNAGDLEFVEGWAGRIADNFWIEAFAPKLHESAAPDLLEYRGVMHGGMDTSWLSGGAWCGSRGTGTPLVAFAIRIKADAQADFACTYKGRFLSGSVVGPFDNGTLCCSESPDDPLVGIELQISRLYHPRANGSERSQIGAA